jgi:hypothetical protein
LEAETEDFSMVTTFTLKPKLFERLEHAARERGQALDTTLQEVVRIGLETSEANRDRAPFRVEPHDFGFRADLDLDRMKRLADELEIEALRPSFESAEGAP